MVNHRNTVNHNQEAPLSFSPEQTSRIMIAKDLDHIEPLSGMGVDANLAAYAAFLLIEKGLDCLLYTSPSPRDQRGSRMPSSA